MIVFRDIVFRTPDSWPPARRTAHGTAADVRHPDTAKAPDFE